MLTKLHLKNFTSFKNETTIDLKSSGYKILSGTNVSDNILKGALFVGGNASGKTNIISGILLLLDLLFSEKVSVLHTWQCLFSKDTSYELAYEFEIDHHTICYSFEYDGHKKCFLIEKLSVDGNELLNRIGSNGHSEITDVKLFSDIDSDALLLREIYFNTKFRSQPVLKKWFDFLLHSIYVNGYEREFFSPGKHPVQIVDFLESPGGVEAINDFFEKFQFNQRIEYANTSTGTITRIDNKQQKNIFFKREGVGEPIPYGMESLGNQNLLNLLPSFFHVIQHGGMLIVDEFSSGLHNFLEELLIQYFMKHSGRAQIFLVSHSTNLLSNSLLRPDQIYAVDFMGLEGSRVKRFSSEKPREAQNLEKMYTSGVFGGVPRYSDEDDHVE